MKGIVRLGCVMSRSEGNARRLGEAEGVPWYTSLEKMIEKEKPDLAILSVARPNHREPVETLCNLGVNMLVETPLAETREDMDAMTAAASRSKSIIEVAEQVYRFPSALIMGEILKTGIMGKPNLVFSHSVGHGYHGIGLIRSLLGFSARPVRVTGFLKTFPVANHIWRAGEPKQDSENWQHGMIEFDSGQAGIYSFSSLTYGSPLRQDRYKNPYWVYAEKGMAMGLDVMYLEGEDRRVEVKIKRDAKTIEGVEVVQAYEADVKGESGFPERLIWGNPLADCAIPEKLTGSALCILDLVNAIRTGKQPEYGIKNGFIDRSIELALTESWTNENKPVMMEQVGI